MTAGLEAVLRATWLTGNFARLVSWRGMAPML
jgi:hypothetical protein